MSGERGDEQGLVHIWLNTHIGIIWTLECGSKKTETVVARDTPPSPRKQTEGLKWDYKGLSGGSAPTIDYSRSGLSYFTCCYWSLETDGAEHCIVPGSILCLTVACRLLAPKSIVAQWTESHAMVITIMVIDSSVNSPKARQNGAGRFFWADVQCFCPRFMMLYWLNSAGDR